MILVATLLCDRKAYSQLYAVPNNLRLTYPDKRIYVNIQTSNKALYEPLFHVLEGTDAIIDTWNIDSGWWTPPRYDQDQARLFPITLAREMARYAAFALGAEWLLYVDADVIIPENSIEVLLSRSKKIIGGTVPGRGVHARARYIFNPKLRRGELWDCDYGTAGFLLLHRDVFSRVPWRYGNSADGIPCSEDPLYGELCRDLGFGRWIIDTTLVAKHLDNPEHPLTREEVAPY